MATYHFAYGRGEACLEALVERRLEEGVLPILHGLVDNEDVKYHFTTFASLERSPLTAETLRGTHFLVADGHGAGPHVHAGAAGAVRGVASRRNES